MRVFKFYMNHRYEVHVGVVVALDLQEAMSHLKSLPWWSHTADELCEVSELDTTSCGVKLDHYFA